MLHAFGGDDGSGNLYGTTFLGGANDAGTIFKVAPDGSFTKLLDLARTMPGASALLVGEDGRLYGTSPVTYFGPLPIGGTVFAIGRR